jgi:hypothetical protein
VVGDWDGNGTSTVGAVDAAGTWYLRNSNSPGGPDIQPFAYGAPGWKPLAGAWATPDLLPVLPQVPGPVPDNSGEVVQGAVTTVASTGPFVTSKVTATDACPPSDGSTSCDTTATNDCQDTGVDDSQNAATFCATGVDAGNDAAVDPGDGGGDSGNVTPDGTDTNTI